MASRQRAHLRCARSRYASLAQNMSLHVSPDEEVGLTSSGAPQRASASKAVTSTARRGESLGSQAVDSPYLLKGDQQPGFATQS